MDLGLNDGVPACPDSIVLDARRTHDLTPFEYNTICADAHRAAQTWLQLLLIRLLSIHLLWIQLPQPGPDQRHHHAHAQDVDAEQMTCSFS
jgi:hypothetical protein